MLTVAGLGLIVLTGLAGGCRKMSSVPASQPARTVRDMTDREVRIPLQPARVLSLCTSATDTLIRLGQGQRLAAIDEYGRVVPGTELVPTVGKGSAVSREQVIAKKIDLAFVWWFQDDVVATLEQLSIPCVRIRDLRLKQISSMLRLIGECMGCSGGAESLIASMPQINSPAVDSPTTVYLEMYGPFKTVGRDCYANDLLQQAGLTNIVAEPQGGLLVSAEKLIQADPSVILFVQEFTSASALSARAGLQDLRAVRTGRVYPIERRWLTAGAGWPLAVEQIRKAIGGSPASSATTSR